MRATSATRETLLQVAREQMLGGGYEGASIDRICRQAGVSKGGFFHYFRSKEELALAVLEHHLQRSAAAFAGAPFLEQPEPLQRLLGYADFTATLCQDPVRDGCMVGLLSQEVSGTHPVIRQACAAAFDQWAGQLELMLEQAIRLHAPHAGLDARSLAEHFIAVFEGALILARARHSAAPVRDGLEHYRRYLTALLAEKPGARRTAPGQRRSRTPATRRTP